MRNAVTIFQRVVEMSEALPKELSAAVGNVSEPSALSDFIAANLHITPEQRQQVLAELDVGKRLQLVLDLLRHEEDVQEVESKIQSQVRGLDKKQRESVLREQMRDQKELGRRYHAGAG
jgi:ATP-dependent Lon protease